MGTTWVLHTETKGTGAQMVPLETVTKRSPSVEPVSVPRKPRRRREPAEPPPRSPRKFRIVDVVTRQELADGAGTQEAVEALKSIRSVVDVNVYVWEEGHDRWRRLTLGERRTLWALSRP
jgi:hypothetical protein